MPSLRRRVRNSRTSSAPMPQLRVRKMGTGSASQKEPQNAHSGNAPGMPRNGHPSSEVHKGHTTVPVELTPKGIMLQSSRRHAYIHASPCPFLLPSPRNVAARARPAQTPANTHKSPSGTQMTTSMTVISTHLA